MRALTPLEHRIVAAMITHARDVDGSLDVLERTRLLADLLNTRVASRCECNTCPSIELVDSTGRAASGEGARVVLSADAPGLIVLLFIDDGRLSYLEGAPVSDGQAFIEFPPAHDLTF